MSDLVKLHWFHAEDSDRDGHMILPIARAHRLMKWSASRPDHRAFAFRMEPFSAEFSTLAKLILFLSTIKADYLAAESVVAFARLYWLELVGLAVAIAAAVGVGVAPKWDRPIVGLALAGVAVIAFALGRRTSSKS